MKNTSCAIFVLKLIFFFAEIGCLGVKQLKNHGVQLFRDLDPILWVLNEDHAHLCVFDTNRTILLPCILQFLFYKFDF